MQTIIAFVGFRGSGKNTAAAALMSYGFTTISFADALKDALAAIFCWERHLLEGITPESRLWREQIDEWWATRLNIPQFTPRWAMTKFGTDTMRRHFNEAIWVLNVEKRIQCIDGPVTLTDARFPDEIALVRRLGGQVFRIQRGADPWWAENALHAIRGDAAHRAILTGINIHESEWAWLAEEVDATIHNNSDVVELHTKVLTATGCGVPNAMSHTRSQPITRV